MATLPSRRFSLAFFRIFSSIVLSLTNLEAIQTKVIQVKILLDITLHTLDLSPSRAKHIGQFSSSALFCWWSCCFPNWCPHVDRHSQCSLSTFCAAVHFSTSLPAPNWGFLASSFSKLISTCWSSLTMLPFHILCSCPLFHLSSSTKLRLPCQSGLCVLMTWPNHQRQRQLIDRQNAFHCYLFLADIIIIITNLRNEMKWRHLQYYPCLMALTRPDEKWDLF